MPQATPVTISFGWVCISRPQMSCGIQKEYTISRCQFSTRLNPITKQLPICRQRKEVGPTYRNVTSVPAGLPIEPWNGFTSEGHSKYYLSSAGSGSTPLYEAR